LAKDLAEILGLSCSHLRGERGARPVYSGTPELIGRKTTNGAPIRDKGTEETNYEQNV